MSKSRAEVEELKAQWLDDGTWDIETTDGFGDYRDELLLFRKETEARRSDERRNKIVDLAIDHNCSMATAEYIYTLEGRLQSLYQRIETIGERLAKGGL